MRPHLSIINLVGCTRVAGDEMVSSQQVRQPIKTPLLPLKRAVAYSGRTAPKRHFPGPAWSLTAFGTHDTVLFGAFRSICPTQDFFLATYLFSEALPHDPRRHLTHHAAPFFPAPGLPCRHDPHFYCWNLHRSLASQPRDAVYAPDRRLDPIVHAQAHDQNRRCTPGSPRTPHF